MKSKTKKKGSFYVRRRKEVLEIVDLKKGFGSGQTRQEVLRGMNFPLQRGVLCVVRTIRFRKIHTAQYHRRH